MATATTPVHTFETKDFALDSGVTLPLLKLAYQTFGQIDNLAKTILVSTCFGEGIKESNPLIGVGKAIDPTNYFVIRIGLLGCGDSSSPSNTPTPYDRENFPRVSYSDMVRAQVLLLESLKIKKLEAVVGFSMGGQVAYHWGILHPEIVERIVCLATSAKTSIHNIAFLEGPIASLEASQDYSVGGRGTKGFGRAYCAWAYSHDWFEQSKWEESGFTSLEDFMTKCWHNDTADGYDLLSLARTWQDSNIAKARVTSTSTAPFKNLKLALNAMKVNALVMPVRTDQYFVPEDSEMEVREMPNGTLRIIESIYGHVGGGGGSPADDIFIDKEVAAFLKV